MECNKDEALRAKEISEAKLAEKDFVGAKKFALKAEKLFHGLEGVSQLLVILDVYISSEKNINGELDWYSVLGVEPTADDETIKKNYKKLALFLHPDKNNSVGAEGAFKLVSQAWALLSDKRRKNVYDQKRNPKSIYQPVFVNQKTSASTTQPVQPVPKPQNTMTFWTACNQCSIHFEYSRVYLNQRIVCTSCAQPFWATESPAPPMNAKKTYPQRHYPNKNLHVKDQQGPSSNSSGVNLNVQNGQSNASGVNRFKNRREAKRAEMRYQTSNSGSASAKSDGNLRRKHVAEQSSTVHVTNVHAKVNSGGQKVNVDNSRRELSQVEIRNMLMTKARKEILKKMDEWNVERAPKKENSVKKHGEETIVSDTSKVKDVKAPLIDAMSTDDKDSDEADAKNYTN